MTSPRRVPIFDGHNDVLLRLYRRGGTDAPQAFLEGEAKGQLDLPYGASGRIGWRVVCDLSPVN
jgi:membrane dipeptidase